MRIALLIPALLLIAACQSSGLTSEQKTQLVDSYLETAEQYFAMGEFDRANAQCIKGLEIDPSKWKLKLVQAWALQKRGKTSDVAAAEKMFRDLQSTGDFRAVLGLAEALERRGLAFSEAAEQMTSGKRVSEAADPAKRVREYEAEAQKAWNESLAHYKKALALQANAPDCFNGLVRVETLRGHPKEALGWAEELIKVTHEDLAFWEEKLKRADISASDEKRFYELVRTLTRLETTAHLHAAELAMALNRDTEALKHLDSALALDPKRAEIYSRRAQVQKELGQPSEAIHDIEQFIALSTLDPNHPDIQRAWRLRKECEDLQRSRF